MIEIVSKAVSELIPYEKNPRKISDEAINAVAESIQEFGFKNPILIDKDNVIIAGHTRRLASLKLGLERVPCVVVDDLTPQQIKALRLADNKTNELADWDVGELNLELEDLLDMDMSRFGFDIDFSEGSSSTKEWHDKLHEKFITPPLSVLDTRQGYWQDRRDIWREKIHSLDGRGDELTFAKRINEFAETQMASTSEFDPVLAEVLISWFCPDNGIIIDPFAGGSVRGIVSSLLGRKYIGIDLSQKQIEENEKNWAELEISTNKPQWVVGDSLEIDKHTEGQMFDFVLACPPYADLEVYSDNPKDLSNMDYDKFKSVYSEIIGKCCKQLNDNSFACIVVAEVRDKKTGMFRNFIEDTKRAFLDAGLKFYNDMVLINSYGTAPARTAHVFPISRKVAKVHQNVLVFLKGNVDETVKKLGEVAVDEEGEEYNV